MARTSLALVAFGLVVERLSLFLHYLGETVSQKQSVRSAIMERMLMWFGTAVAPIGLWRFLIERRTIGEPSNRSSMWAVVVVASSRRRFQ